MTCRQHGRGEFIGEIWVTGAGGVSPPGGVMPCALDFEAGQKWCCISRFVAQGQRCRACANEHSTTTGLERARSIEGRICVVSTASHFYVSTCVSTSPTRKTHPHESARARTRMQAPVRPSQAGPRHSTRPSRASPDMPAEPSPTWTQTQLRRATPHMQAKLSQTLQANLSPSPPSS